MFVKMDFMILEINYVMIVNYLIILQSIIIVMLNVVMELYNGMKNVTMEYKYNVMDVINVNYLNLNVKLKYVRFVIRKNVYNVKMDII